MRVIVLLFLVGVTIYALVDCWRSTDDEVRGLPRPAWLLAILAIPLIGGIAYLVLGRPIVVGGTVISQRRVIAPDDDPDFLRSLEQQRRRAAADQKRARERKDRKSSPESGGAAGSAGREQGSDGDDHSHPTL